MSRIIATQPILERAPAQGDMELFNLALEQGIVETKRCMLSLYSASFPDGDFADACRDGDLERAQQAIKEGARDLHWGIGEASKNGHLEIVQYLVSQGASIDLDFKGGAFALGDALIGHHFKVARYLSRQYAVPSSRRELPRKRPKNQGTYTAVTCRCDWWGFQGRRSESTGWQT